MKQSKLKQIAFELTQLWSNFTRQELCDVFHISSKTLYRYSKELNLPKKIDKVTQEKINPKEQVCLWIKQEPQSKTFKRTAFKNWQQFSTWTKAQSRPIKIDVLEQNGKRYTTCVFNSKKKPEAIEFEKALNI